MSAPGFRSNSPALLHSERVHDRVDDRRVRIDLIAPAEPALVTVKTEAIGETSIQALVVTEALVPVNLSKRIVEGQWIAKGVIS